MANSIETRLKYLETLGGVSAALHAATHIAGGTDPVTLSESQITNLVTDLAALQPTATLSEAIDDRVAALLVAGTNVTLTYNDGANTLTVAATGGSGGGATVKETLVNVGSTPVSTASIVVTDAAVTTASRIALGWGGVVDTDENSPDMDAVTFAAVPGTGQFTARIAAISGLIRGTFRLNYVTG